MSRRIEAAQAEAARLAILLRDAGSEDGARLATLRAATLQDALAMLVEGAPTPSPLAGEGRGGGASTAEWTDVVEAMATAEPLPPLTAAEEATLAALLDEEAPTPATRKKSGRAPDVWTPERTARLGTGWAEGESDEALFDALNALPGPPIGSPAGVRKHAGVLRLRRSAAYMAQLNAAKIAAMRAAVAAAPPRAPVTPIIMPPPGPPAAAAPPEPAPAAPPSHAHQVKQALALLREGHTETVIATRTALPIAEVRGLISTAEGQARDLLLAGGLGTDDIVVATSLPAATIRALRKELAGSRAA